MGIRILQSKVISQIAAGEVVERPSSVVKELFENSIDAGATQISIEVKDGGVSLIRVSDNGIGIPDEETELAFTRHATSKIDNLSDLEHLTTLGFRGEALPSISSVSQVQMQTRHKDAQVGTNLVIHESIVLKHEPQARMQGTTITVQNLFRKVPARLKFLKSTGAETSRINDIVSRYALAYPEIRLTYIVDGKTRIHTPVNGKLIDSVIAVYGSSVAGGMIDIEPYSESWENGSGRIEISGMLSSPQLTRSNRDDITFFVNRRWVNNRMLAFAFEEAYHGLLMQDKHPIGIINITINPEMVDVNVHPAKTEIKFQNDRAVFAAVQKAVRQTLVQNAPVPQVEEVKPSYNAVPDVKAETTIFTSPEPQTPVTDEKPPETYQPQSSVTPMFSLPLLRVLGQFARNYIIAEGPEALFLIDQHAAHERIMFEKIRKQKSESKVEMQTLLEPAVFEPGIKLADLFEAHLSELAEFGFNIEPFGDKAFLVRAIPSILRNRDWTAALREMVEKPEGDWAETIISKMACHAAVRSGQVLNEDQMRELIRQLEQTDLPNTCPHGRPTIIQIGLKQIEKYFGRT